MIPVDYEKLKDDQEFLYFLKSLKNKHFWFMELDNKNVKRAVTDLLKNIDLELVRNK